MAQFVTNNSTVFHTFDSYVAFALTHPLTTATIQVNWEMDISSGW
jgi:hypothetical protein